MLPAPQHATENRDRQSQKADSSHGSASWPRDSTSYAELASNVGVMSTCRPQSPQPGPSGVSYAAAAATPASPTNQTHTQQNASRTVQRSSAYPPITVERLPNWTSHFNVLKETIGHAPNARPMGNGVRFLPGSEHEFRTIQRYLTEASNQDKSISWFCYSPLTEIPTKVAVRGLPLDTPPEEVVGALQHKGFPATRAKAILPTRSRHGCTYFVQLDHLNRQQLQELYGTTELLCMPGITVEGWKPGRSPAQCHRCQAFGHASDNCHRPPRCVRCAGEHLARDCPKPVNDPPTCANCGKGHIARDRKCAVLRKEARKRGINLAPLRPSAPLLRQKMKRPTATLLFNAIHQASSAVPTGEAPHQTPSATPSGEIPHVASSDAPTHLTPYTTTVSGGIPTPQRVNHTVDDEAPAMQQFTETVTQPQATQTVLEAATAGPSTLAPPANPPTRRGQSLPKKKKRKRQARPVIAELSNHPPVDHRGNNGRSDNIHPGPRHHPSRTARTDHINEGNFTLRVLYWNPGGIRGHIRELTLLAQSQNIHVILLGETKLSERVELRIPNFFVYRRDEVSPQGYSYRGTAALVRRDIAHDELEQAPFVSLRTQGVRIQFGDKELRLYAAYKPPAQNFDASDIRTLFESQEPTLVVGDLNAKHHAWGSRVITPTGRWLLEDSERYGYGILGPGAPTHIPTEARWQPDVLDIVLQHKVTHPIDVEVIYDLDTQHLPILVSLTHHNSFQVPRSPRTRVDWKSYSAEIEKLELAGPISSANDVEAIASRFTLAIQKAKDNATTAITSSKPYGRQNPLPRLLRDKLRKKRDLRKLWARTRCPRVKRDLNRVAEELSLDLVALNDEHWEDTVERASENETSLFHLCKKLTGQEIPIYPLLDQDGKRRYSASDRAGILAEYMEGQFTPNVPNDTNDNIIRHHEHIYYQVQAFLSAQTPSLQGEYFISPSELRKVVIRLPRRKAPGPDSIPNIALQQLPRRGLVSLTRLFNGILRTGHFPETWKIGKVIVLPKPGKDRRLPASYRPITLLSHVAKLFERLLLRRLEPHLPLREEQFGFRNSHSTTLQLTRVTNHLASQLNNKQCTVGVFLDIEKAFDRVWHAGLLAKLINTTTPPAIVRVLASFLERRSFYVSVEGVDSQPHPIKAGVPQGSCLSPRLYAAYTDDIPTLRDHLCEGEEDVLLALYADDSAYFTSSYHQIVATNKMQRLLDLLPEWLDKWRMAINVGKTAALLTSGSKPLRQLTLRGQNIEWKTSVRYLGCHIDRKLHMVPTVNHVVSQAAAARSMLHSLFTSKLTTRTKLKVYGAYVRSRLTYAAPSWYTFCSAYQKKRLQTQQNRCLRLIVGAQRYVRNDVIHRDTRTQTVEEFVQHLARTMFARADTSACLHLHGIAPLQSRNPKGLALPRELLCRDSIAPPNPGVSGDEEEDT